LIFVQAHKEEKKERLRLEIEDIKLKEKEKERLYFETVEKFNKRNHILN